MKTALQNFIDSIVLKQIKGSVYLVPAICDFQIDEALENEKQQLNDFAEYLQNKRFEEPEKNLMDFVNEWMINNE